jgi:phosphate transport system substrate-binding protein
VFSLGIVFWELLTLERGAVRDCPRELLGAVLGAMAPHGFDLAFLDVAVKALSAQPEDRFGTALEMRDALLVALHGPPWSTEQLSRWLSEEFADARARRRAHIRACMPPLVARTSSSVVKAAPEGLPELTPSSLPALDELSPSSLSRDAPTERLPVEARSSSFGAHATTPQVPPVSSVTAPESAPPARRRVVPFAIIGVLLCVAGGLAVGLVLKKETRQVGAVSEAKAAVHVVLHLQGSNTIGAGLAPALAEAFLRGRGASVIARRAGAKPLDTFVTGRLDPNGEESAIEIIAEGSATAFAGLAKGACDIGMSSRRIKPEEAQELAGKGLGDLRSPAGEHVLALDGLAVVVHPNNPLRQLDLSQLSAIFKGDVSDWSALGGPPGPIHLLARDDASGTYDTFRHLVLGDAPLAASAGRMADSQALSDAVAADPAAVGFIGLVYVRNAKPLAIKEGSTRPLFPSAFTVATEDYALARRLYLYTPVRTTNPMVNEFVNFALSTEGQQVVRSSGFVDLNVSMTDPRACDDGCAPRYASLTRGARRLSLDFRFRSGSADLDSRGQRDLERLVRFLGVSESMRVMLLGFSDNRGASANNLRLSQDRAKVIEGELVERGVTPSVVEALGDQMPVAANDTEVGREKNRRVEVWVASGAARP